MSNTAGYIVTDNSNRALFLGQFRVLWISDSATLFNRRAMAQRAIKRTQAYAFREGLTWGDEYRILRITYQRNK